MSIIFPQEDIKTILEISQEAGKILLSFFQKEINVNTKSDNSPVTEADIKVNDFLCKELERFYSAPIVSEENSKSSNVEAAKNQEFWLIDPLDGTRAFLNHDSNFVICIAIVNNSRPDFGLIHIPFTNHTYYNIGGEAFMCNNDQQISSISVKDKKSKLNLISSHRMKKNKEFCDFVESKDIKNISAISSAIKFCHIASGEAQIYPHFLDTMHWDSAAGDAIVHAAGGNVTDLNGQKLLYGNYNDFKNPHFIVSSNGKTI